MKLKCYIYLINTIFKPKAFLPVVYLTFFNPVLLQQTKLNYYLQIQLLIQNYSLS